MLTDLEENRENRPYLDKIYHQIGEYHQKNGSDSLAERYYNKSLRSGSSDKYLNATVYQTLGNMRFDRAEYKMAGAYYDSTLSNLTENTREYRSVQRKRVNLDDVIYYEDLARRNDSILDLVAMSEEERLALFTKYTDELKQQAKELAEKEALAERNQGLISSDSDQPGFAKNGLATPGRAETFYFYNPVTVAFGKNEFTKTWGQRQLEDNWRWSDKRTRGLDDLAVDEELANATEEELHDPQFYISRIPVRANGYRQPGKRPQLCLLPVRAHL